MKKIFSLSSIISIIFLMLLFNCQQPSSGGGGGAGGHGGSKLPSAGNDEQNIIATVDGNGNPGSNVGSCSSLAVSGNNIYISYFDIDDTNLKFAKSIDNGKNWTTTTLDSSGNVGLYSSITVSGNNIYITYRDQTNRSLKFMKSPDAGVTWITKVVDTGDAGYDTSIAVSGSNIYISYCDYRDPSNPINSRLKFIKSTDNGATWPVGNIKIVDNADNVGRNTSIAVSGNNVYISYYDQPNGSLKFAKSIDGGTNWGTSIIEDFPNTNTGYDTSIAISGVNVFISYYYAGAGKLKYAKSIDSGTNWTTYEIDNNGIVGAYTSVEVSGTNIFISYRDSSNDDLKFAKSTDSGANWNKKTVDSDASGEADDVGYYTSIAVSGNYIYISYYDETNGNLKFAKSIDGGETW